MTGIIESIDKDHGVCTVLFNSGEIRKIPRAVIHAAKIHCGMQIDPQTLDSILAKHMESAAYARCAALLSMKSQTEHQLRDSLKKVFYPPDIIEKVISSLLNAGYVNDKAFAEHWISHRSASGIGKARIRTELRIKGISAEIIDETFSRAFDYQPTIEEAEAGLKHAFEKALRNRDLSDPKERKKVVAALVRKGYSFSEAYKAIKDYG